MLDNQRSAKRNCLPGLRATYEIASGAREEARVFNLSRTGLFLETAIHVPIGKRLSLEIHVAGEALPWAALGRVIWARPSRESAEHPCGMGVKIIDADESVLDAIQHLIEEQDAAASHEELERQFEQTIQGMGAAQIAEVPMAAMSEPLVTPLMTPRTLTREDLQAALEDEKTPVGPGRDAESSPTGASLLPVPDLLPHPAIHVSNVVPATESADLPSADLASSPSGTELARASRGPWIVAAVVVLGALAFYALRSFLPAQ